MHGGASVVLNFTRCRFDGIIYDPSVYQQIFDGRLSHHHHCRLDPRLLGFWEQLGTLGRSVSTHPKSVRVNVPRSRARGPGMYRAVSSLCFSVDGSKVIAMVRATGLSSSEIVASSSMWSPVALALPFGSSAASAEISAVSARTFNS